MKMFKPALAVVTGGASGIGTAMAKELAARGAHVVVADINLENALTVRDRIGGSCEAVKLDVCNEQQVQAFFHDLTSRRGVPDCVVNCAGVNSYGEALYTPPDEWLNVLSINLIGTVLVTLAAYKAMATQGRGKIINMGSMATFLVDPMFNAYTTSKFGVVGFSRSLAVEAQSHGIDVCVVCPGNIKTPMRGNNYELSRFTPAMSVEAAVAGILRGVERRKGIIVFPFHARVLWWIDRLNPNILWPIRKEIFRRALRRAGTSG